MICTFCATESKNKNTKIIKTKGSCEPQARPQTFETEQGRAYRVWLAQCVDSLQQEVAYLRHGLEAGDEEEKNVSVNHSIVIC
jgi:hypothetical protein